MQVWPSSSFVVTGYWLWLYTLSRRTASDGEKMAPSSKVSSHEGLRAFDCLGYAIEFFGLLLQGSNIYNLHDVRGAVTTVHGASDHLDLDKDVAGGAAAHVLVQVAAGQDGDGELHAVVPADRGRGVEAALGHVVGLEDVAAAAVLAEPAPVQLQLLVRGLEVERGHLRAGQPEGHRVEVGRVGPATLQECELFSALLFTTDLQPTKLYFSA